MNSHSVRTAPGVKDQLSEISEHIGEAVGLSVISEIHELTEADWHKIAKQAGRKAKPSFDFGIASDEKYRIEIENKGSSVLNNDVISAADQR